MVINLVIIILFTYLLRVAKKHRGKKTMTACMRKVGIPSIPNRVEGFGPGKHFDFFFSKLMRDLSSPFAISFCPRDFPTSTFFADEKQLEALRDLEILNKISHQKEEFQV